MDKSPEVMRVLEVARDVCDRIESFDETLNGPMTAERAVQTLTKILQGLLPKEK